jgi:hypothetical protein
MNSFKTIALTTALLLSLIVAGTGCQSANRGADAGPRLGDHDYGSLLAKHTRHDASYEGFYNKFELHVLFLNTQVQTAILQKRSDTLVWDTATAQRERERVFQENATQTRFFMSFFSPAYRVNDLHKGTSIWKIYLEVDGKRYEGKVVKSKAKLEELQATYPFHTRWGLPLEVTFSVPLSGVEKSNPVFILTSSQGSSRLKF